MTGTKFELAVCTKNEFSQANASRLISILFY